MLNKREAREIVNWVLDQIKAHQYPFVTDGKLDFRKITIGLISGFQLGSGIITDTHVSQSADIRGTKIREATILERGTVELAEDGEVAAGLVVQSDDSRLHNTFSGLTDTPAGYAGAGSRLVVVKEAEDGLEFVGASGIDFSGLNLSFIDLNDTPSTYSGHAGQVPVVSEIENILQFSNIDHGTLSGLSHVADHPGYLVTDGSRELTDDMSVSAGKTIDGRDLSVDGAKLDGIEAGADVTDADNVNAAGAVMESDFDATTFLYATADDTPQPKTPAEVLSILSAQADALFDWNSQTLSGITDLIIDGDFYLQSAATIVAPLGLTMPAFTLGGDITVNGKTLQLGTGALNMYTSGAWQGMGVYNSAGAPYFYVLQQLASPNDNDPCGFWLFYGRNDAAEDTRFGMMSVVALDVSDDSEDGRWEFHGLTGGSENLAMTLTGAGDLWIDNDLSVDGEISAATLASLTVTGDITVNDDIFILFGGVAKLGYETKDANANVLLLALPESGATDVAVFVIGDQSALDKDLGFFNGLTGPYLAILGPAAGRHARLGWSAALDFEIRTDGDFIDLKHNSDTYFFRHGVANNVPIIWGKGAYLSVGDAAVTSHGLNYEDDLLITGDFEVDGVAYFDDSVVLASGLSVVGEISAATIAAFQATGAIDFNNQEMTNVDINSGTISGVDIDGDLTWSAPQSGMTLVSPIIGGAAGEGHITVHCHAYDSIGQGTWAWNVDSGSVFCGYWNNTSSADGDEISYKVYLAAGTYTLRLMCWLAQNAGIVDVYIDADEVASIDFYQAGWTKNQYKTETGITVATSGLKTLKFVLDGKNASSSDYFCILQAISLWRTA